MDKKLIKKGEKKKETEFDFLRHSGDGFIKSEPSLEALCKHFSRKYDKTLRKLAL